MSTVNVPQVRAAAPGRALVCVGCAEPIGADDERYTLLEDPRRPYAVTAASHVERFGADDEVDAACVRTLRAMWSERCAELGWRTLVAGVEQGGRRHFVGDHALRCGEPIDVLLADGTVVAGRYEAADVGATALSYFSLGGWDAPSTGCAIPPDALVRVPADR